MKKVKKHICFIGIYNLRPKPKFLTQIIVRDYLIIAYYM